ncbi:Golgi apparatus membrane protein tvp15 [Cyphellophora attinorum]|uniref:Golgi apparatus membrane protein tvp15 n=1 Tax=Cyphellophora attinorum TaxID=1664694 RepID=A0A0N0NHV4_9EURO|nr:Golgi apparatus membrane protein tvp15 [Phialophora attinorum]KPI35111.1 Golgi apparatus membrane protein tvp15 [Phialophora attinorum]
MAVGASMLVGSIAILTGGISIRNVVVAVYVILFGLAVGGLELLPQVPPYLPKYASFLFSFLGRGLFYLFVGSLVLEHGTFSYIIGGIIMVAGLGYAALEFIPSIEPPSNMRDADAGWGAEQV